MRDIKFLPEWVEQEGILLSLPHEDTDWNYMLHEVHECYRGIISALMGEGIKCYVLCKEADEAMSILKPTHPELLYLIEYECNDTWTRDYGPLTVVRNDRLRALDFGFNGWGLKFAANRDNLACKYLRDGGYFKTGIYRDELDFVLEGGSVETDGEGTILTTSTCLCSPNRNGGRTKGELNEILAERLGASHVLWLDYGHLAGDDTDSHIDTLARLCPDNTILFVGCHDESDPHFDDLLKMRAQLTMFRNAEGNPYNLVELPWPDAVYDPVDGHRLPATYANYLVANGCVFVPTYRQPANDRLALEIIRSVYSERKIIGVDSLPLLRQHGSLHCATMQLPKGITLEKEF